MPKHVLNACIGGQVDMREAWPVCVPSR
jgi:hypothetical protein